MSLIARIIKADPALCFTALALDRSLTFSTPPSVPHDMHRLLHRIGCAGVETIIAGIMTIQATTPLYHRQALALEWLNRHARMTARLALALARQVGWPDPEEVYLAGLLHDIDKLLLLGRTPAACISLLDTPDRAMPLIEAEAEMNGSNHHRIGARLIDRYTYAGTAAEAARYQGESLQRIKQARPPVRMVWAADRMASEPMPSPETVRAAAALLGIRTRQLIRLTDTALGRTAAAEEATGRQGRSIHPGNDRRHAASPLPWRRAITQRVLLAGVYRQLLAASTTADIGAALGNALAHFPGIVSAVLLIRDSHRNRLNGRAAAGTIATGSRNRLQIPLTATGCLPVRCHAKGEPVAAFLRDDDDRLTIIDRQLMTALNSDGLFCLPLSGDGDDPDGCLALGIDAARWHEIQPHRKLLGILGRTMVGTLHKIAPAPSSPADATEPAMDPTRIRKIVHEINNPLSIIKKYLKVIASRTEKETPGSDELRIINEELNRTALLVRSLTTPVSVGWPRAAAVDVNATLTDLVHLLRQGVFNTAAIHVKMVLARDLPRLTTDRDRLKQALINLLKNAAEATPAGGTVTVSTRLTRMTGTAGRPGIRIGICDTGAGIDRRVGKDLYRPFVTSKDGHDGLGLTIVKETVTSIGGELECVPAPGQGTCFNIALPVDETKPDIAIVPHTAT